MAPPAAEITRPAGAARFLPLDAALMQPSPLRVPVHTGADVAHRVTDVVDKTMARENSAIRRDSEITGACPARIGAVRSTVNFLHSARHIRKWVRLAAYNAPLKLTSAFNHLIKQCLEMLRRQFVAAAWRGKHRREAHAVKTEAD